MGFYFLSKIEHWCLCSANFTKMMMKQHQLLQKFTTHTFKNNNFPKISSHVEHFPNKKLDIFSSLSAWWYDPIFLRTSSDFEEPCCHRAVFTTNNKKSKTRREEFNMSNTSSSNILMKLAHFFAKMICGFPTTHERRCRC